MARVGPYTLLHLLSDARIAESWLAQDDNGQPMVVVVLASQAQHDEARRSAFLYAMVFVNQALASQGVIAASENTAHRPWVAFYGENDDPARQLFAAMNAPYGSGQLPVIQPQAYPAYEPPLSSPPVSGTPVTGYPRAYYGGPQPPSRSRRVLTGLGVVVLVLVLGVGGGYLAFSGLSSAGGKDPGGQRSGNPQAPPGEPDAAPGVLPAKEPAQQGTWPSAWSTFQAGDKTVQSGTQADLGFEFRMPAGWVCVKQEAKDGGPLTVHCADKSATSPPPGTESGGEIIVRTCDNGCSDTRQKELRAREHGWGLPLYRADETTYFTRNREAAGPAGKQQQMLVIRYLRSRPGGPLDRQVTLRMTSPVEQGWVLERMANEFRASTSK
ncbi:hypothetical protein [Longispora albida]|uniref:hypothetical protein n=1 Tax=Longispora albida TaxID=203523 RepID=UPI00039B8927|nr:hypothetical protein [Longispora albida]